MMTAQILQYITLIAILISTVILMIFKILPNDIGISVFMAIMYALGLTHGTTLLGQSNIGPMTPGSNGPLDQQNK